MTTSPPSTERSIWRTGCLVGGTFVMAACALSCGFLFFAGRGLLGDWVLTASLADSVQRQADAMGHDPPDYAQACRENSATLNSITPCPLYIAWILRSAPFLPGARIRIERIDFDTPRDGKLRLGLYTRASGPQGNGRLRFTVVQSDRGLLVDEVRPW